jgi:hypothetical protein
MAKAETVFALLVTLVAMLYISREIWKKIFCRLIYQPSFSTE